MRGSSSSATDLPLTKSRPACFLLSTSWRSIAPWPPPFPRIACALIVMASGPPSRQSASARPSHLNNDYLEDPVFGMHGMRRTREKIRVPLATNTVVVNFEQLAANVLDTAVDVILLDTTFWGGIRPCIKGAAICETFQLGVAVHSSGELGIQLATMLHLGAVIPNLSFAADAHYHHLTDDIIQGGLMRYENGTIAVPDGPGLGVKLDREKVAQYS